MSALPPPDKPEQTIRDLTAWLLRFAAALMLGLGIEYWIRLVGIRGGPLWRFDLMPVWWKMAAPALAVLYPIAAVGLWMTVSWGAVVWVIVALVEASMHLMFPSLFGAATLPVALHGAGLLLLAGLRLAGWWRMRRRLSRMSGYTPR